MVLRDGRKLIGILRSFDQFGNKYTLTLCHTKEAPTSAWMDKQDQETNYYILSPPKIANLVLQDTIERIYVADTYGDIPRGIFIIRGENVVLLGEIVRYYPLSLASLAGASSYGLNVLC